jgi:hypothetical protein
MFVVAIRAHVGALALTATTLGLSHPAFRIDRKIDSVAHATNGGKAPLKIGTCMYHQDVPNQRRRRPEPLLPREVPVGHQYRCGTSRVLSLRMPLSRAASATVADASSEFYASSTSFSEG